GCRECRADIAQRLVDELRDLLLGCCHRRRSSFCLCGSCRRRLTRQGRCQREELVCIGESAYFPHGEGARRGQMWPLGPDVGTMAEHPTDALIGDAPALAELRDQIRLLSAFDTRGNPNVPTVLLQGETGTGKGLVARVVHLSGGRAQDPFVDVNCAAIPETMLEAGLFGFEAGAVTGANPAQ